MSEKRFLGFMSRIGTDVIYPIILSEIPPKEHNGLARNLVGSLIEVPDWIEPNASLDTIVKYYDPVARQFRP